MKKIVDWISTHKLLTLGITVLLMVVQPIFVHWMFKTKAISPYWVQTWDAGDLLGYLAGFEAFVGTVFLGVVAAKQNDKANELNKQMLDAEEKHRKFERRPIVEILARDVSIQPLNAILNHDGPVYSSINLVANPGYPSEYKGKEYYLCSWEVRNTGYKQIWIKLAHLELEEFGEQTKLVYDGNWINLKSPLQYIAPQQKTGIGFIIEIQELDQKPWRIGRLELEVLNEVDECYKHSQVFSIAPLVEGGFGLYLLGDG